MPEKKLQAWDRFRTTQGGKVHCADHAVGVSHGPEVEPDTYIGHCSAAANVSWPSAVVERTAPITCAKCIRALKKKISRAALAAGCPVPGSIVWVNGLPAEARHAIRDETMDGDWRVEFVLLSDGEPGGFTALDHWRRYPTTRDA